MAGDADFVQVGSEQVQAFAVHDELVGPVILHRPLEQAARLLRFVDAVGQPARHLRDHAFVGEFEPPFPLLVPPPDDTGVDQFAEQALQGVVVVPVAGPDARRQLGLPHDDEPLVRGNERQEHLLHDGQVGRREPAQHPREVVGQDLRGAAQAVIGRFRDQVFRIALIVQRVAHDLQVGRVDGVLVGEILQQAVGEVVLEPASHPPGRTRDGPRGLFGR